MDVYGGHGVAFAWSLAKRIGRLRGGSRRRLHLLGAAATRRDYRVNGDTVHSHPRWSSSRFDTEGCVACLSRTAPATSPTNLETVCAMY